MIILPESLFQLKITCLSWVITTQFKCNINQQLKKSLKNNSTVCASEPKRSMVTFVYRVKGEYI